MSKTTFKTIFFFLFFISNSWSQSINNWQFESERNYKQIVALSDKKTIPSEYKIFNLDIESVKTTLKRASIRNSNNQLANNLLVDFPFEDGSFETFSIEKVSVLHPDLEAKYPDILSYFGVSQKNPLNKIYISLSPQGFTGLITGEKTIYIDPVSSKNQLIYMVYDRKSCTKNPDDIFECNANEIEKVVDQEPLTTTAQRNSTDGKLRTYRLALACTSQYSAYYGNTVSNVLSAMNTTVTRINSVFRRDFGVVFQLVASNNRLIYINGFNIDATPDPDPYDNYNGTTMLNANTPNITGLLGVSAYDIGHVFSTGGGGLAGTGPCAAATKGNGVTGIVTPQYDPFDIDYVAHEIGHQFGAGHTQNNNCQRAATSAMEPGSASTIMGYAGICAPNVQGNSDAYFHAISIQQINASIATHTCEVETAILNSEPVVTAMLNYSIPKSTPFELKGTATDAEADPMTYTWEQMNNETTGVMPPIATNPGSPNFRSFAPTTSSSRTFPNLAAIISNTTPTWEVLPSVARTLNFRMTVRDNSILGGQTNQANSVVTVSGTAGPFVVTAPNLGTEIWYVGESKTITWNVASTNTATFSTTVNIKLSIDGGFTYPITLASAVANSGSQAITVPNNIGKLNRIKIEAAANIFFDISNANFEIKSGKFEMTTAQNTVSVCKPNNGVYTFNYTPAPGFAELVTFSTASLPSGAVAAFVPANRSTAGTVTLTVSNITAVATGNFSFSVKGISTTANETLAVLLNVFDNTIENISLSNPVNGATNQQTSALLQWQNLVSASSYLVQISTNPTFSTITETATVSTAFYQTTALATGTINYWRVKPINPCTTGIFSEVFVFQIATDICKNYSNVYFENNDSTWEINTTNAVSARINIPDNIIISDVNFYMKATHPLLSDIKMQFSGPTGIFAEIYNRDCTGANIDVTFDDSGTALPVPCATTLSGVKQASQLLSKFNGTSSLGTWVLLATDRVANTSGGTFQLFNIDICGKLQIVNNIAVSNNPLSVQIGSTASVLQTNLIATQPTALASQLIYTLTQLPTRGVLKLNNIGLILGNTFSQTDLNNGLVSYTNDGINGNSDSFKFSISGINTALLGAQTFVINVCAITNTTSQTNISCFGGNTGSATVVASGGSGGYTYLWSPSGGTAATASNLLAGNYSCLITDALGCNKTQNFVITQAVLLSNTTSQTNVSCFGGNTGSATVVASGGTGGYTYLWSPSGGTAATASNLAAGNYSCLITDALGCNKTQNFVITQAALLSNTTSQTNVSCFGGNTGSATVVASGGTGGYTYLWSPSGGTAATASNLVAGNYSCLITDTLGCNKTQNFVITQPVSTTWNGSIWTNGTPTEGCQAIIAANYEVVTNLIACSLIVNNNANVTVLSGYNFTVSGSITVETGASFTLNSNANLLQSGVTNTNSGNITVKREASMRRLDYVYWASPVENQNLLSFSPDTLTNRFYTYSEPNNAFEIINPLSNNFEKAKGYNIRASNLLPADGSIVVVNQSFFGKPNNGTISIPITKTPTTGVGYNLIGNPYPSTISATAFLATNPGTIYFWTHFLQGSTASNYASFTTLGPTASISGGILPNGFIQTGQGFMFKTTASGNAIFLNSMRVANNSNQFFKTIESNKSRIWLHLKSPTNQYNQILVGYMNGATTGFDESIDGIQIENNNNSISSLINGDFFAIQGRGLPFVTSDVIKLGLKTIDAGNYSIGIDQVDGIFESIQTVFLKDNFLGLSHNLSQSDYNFVANVGSFNTRFELIFENLLSTQALVEQSESIVVYPKNEILTIESNRNTIKNVYLFDLRGRKIYEQHNIFKKMVSLQDLPIQNTLLMVKIVLENGTILNKKVIY